MNLIKITQLSSLSYLGISEGNDLSNLQGLSKLNTLKSLKISTNNLGNKYWPGIEHLVQLNSLEIEAPENFDLTNVYLLKNLKKLIINKEIKVDSIKLKKSNPGIAIVRN